MRPIIQADCEDALRRRDRRSDIGVAEVPVGCRAGDGARCSMEFVEPSPRVHRVDRYGPASHPRRVEPAPVGIDEGGSASHVGESERHGSSGVSGASQAIDAETQWVSCSAWSLRWRCRGGVTNVA